MYNLKVLQVLYVEPIHFQSQESEPCTVTRRLTVDMLVDAKNSELDPNLKNRETTRIVPVHMMKETWSLWTTSMVEESN